MTATRVAREGMAVLLGAGLACTATGDGKRSEEGGAPVVAAPEVAVPETPAPVGPSDEEVAATAESRRAVFKSYAVAPPGLEWAFTVGEKAFKAGDYVGARAAFAHETSTTPSGWRSPFGFAQAALKLGDLRLVRVGLAQAVAYNRDYTAQAVATDRDFEAVRTMPWYVALIRDAPPGSDARAPEPKEPEPAEAIVGDPPRTPPKQPKATSKPLEKEPLAQLRAGLEQKHGLAVRVRASLALPQANGEVLGFAVYDYGRFKACMLTASKADCREQLGGASDAPELIESTCVDTWLVRVRIGATLTIDEPVALEYNDPPLTSCKLTKVRRLAAADYDGDGSDEILLDAFGSREGEGEAIGPIIEAWRVYRVVRLDGTMQLDLDDAWFLSGETQPVDEALGKRYWFRDVDGDGHLDVEIEDRGLRVPDSVDAADLWPELEAEPEGPVTYAVWPYAPATDAWVSPPEAVEAEAAAAVEAATPEVAPGGTPTPTPVSAPVVAGSPTP